MAIFYLKPEEIFEKYGDKEAEIFYAEQEKQKEAFKNERETRNKNNRGQRGNNKDSRSNASNDAFIEGISFRKSQGPPTFKSTKKAENGGNEGGAASSGSHRIVT